ncbi:MAG: hypothetical protein MJK04_20155, partial [Psychrosphaera sp.]|nr:hypothetical protein [Psychrosphaera sp.]
SEVMISGGVCCDNSPFMYMSFSKTPAFTTNDDIRPFDNDSKGLESDDQEYEQELVFYRGDRKTDRQLLLELNQLFVDINCELQVLQLQDCVG